MSDDFQAMMKWLTNETVQGLAFNAGSSYDPPSELKPWRMQPDLSLGLGVVPLNKGKFPFITTPALAALDPASFLPNNVTFPNLALHLRMGLPSRMDLSFRGANMTVPHGYKLSGSTRGDGQSNSVGATVRKHFLGDGERPLLSLGANYNYVFGHFNFQNEFKGLALVPGVLVVDSVNTGRLDWHVTSLGANAVLSQAYGSWTPYVGFGYNHMSGSVGGTLRADFATPLIQPSIGVASDTPEEHQVRALFGVQLGGTWLNVFVNGEIKAIGASAGKTFLVSTGLVAPFRIGAQSFAKRGEGTARARRIALEPEEPKARAVRARLESPAPRRVPSGSYRRKTPQSEDLPEMIFIR